MSYSRLRYRERILSLFSLAHTVLGDPAVRSLLEASGVWLWDCDLRTDITDYQEGFWEHYGHDPSAMTETFEFLSVMHNRDIRGVTKAWRAHIDGEADDYKAQWRLRTGWGEWRWIQAYGRVVERDSDGKATRMVGAYTDVTMAKKAQTELAGSNAEMDAIFRGARDGLVLVGPDLKVLRANQSAIDTIEAFSGYRLFEGDDILNVPSVSPDRPVISDIREALAGRRDVPDRTFPSQSGAMWLEFSYQPIYLDSGSILGAAVTLRDVTEKRRMEHTRAQALRMESIGLMAGGIAHDFNNMLSAIVGNVELARMSVADPDVRSTLEDARAAADRASELVAQLLQFAGKHEPVMSDVDVSALAREICRYARRIPGTQVPLREELASGLPFISGDATQLRQLILNLVVNALEATREQGTQVTVRTMLVPNPETLVPDMLLEPRPAPSYLALQVCDDGPGMDQFTLDHLWDLFFTTKPTGHGLGLPGVLGTVRSHGGTLSVQSEPAKGATFTVLLPCS